MVAETSSGCKNGYTDASTVVHNLGDRDPQRIHAELKDTNFQDIFGEPTSAIYSLDKVWILANQVFGPTKLWCYRGLTLCLALPAAIVWAIVFGLLSFCNIWCCMPYYKACRLPFHYLQLIWRGFIKSIVAPISEASGRCCGGIRIRYSEGPLSTVEDKQYEPVQIA